MNIYYKMFCFTWYLIIFLFLDFKHKNYYKYVMSQQKKKQQLNASDVANGTAKRQIQLVNHEVPIHSSLNNLSSNALLIRRLKFQFFFFMYILYFLLVCMLIKDNQNHYHIQFILFQIRYWLYILGSDVKQNKSRIYVWK